MKFKLNKKKFKQNDYCLVTGAAGFIGAIHCECALEQNYNLIMVDVDAKNLKKIESELKKKFKHLNIISYITDITVEKKIKLLEAKLTKEKIFIKALINNACIDPKPVNKKKNKDLLKTWDRELDVGLKGCYLMIEYFSRKMIKNKSGCIINIASDLSVIAPNQSLYDKIYRNFEKPVTYSIIKHGLLGITKYYAAKYGKYNITCNAISPVGIFNDQNKKFVNRLKKLIPMNRMANKEDIKYSVNFLLSEKQKFITGHNLVIDGGRTII